MDQQPHPSTWAAAQFGAHASEVTRHVAVGLSRGQRSARIVHEVATAEGAVDRRAYGSMWAARYKVVVDQFELAGLPGYEAIKPKGASYSLAVINGRVLIPFRHSTSLKEPIWAARIGTKIPRAVSRENGVQATPTLFDVDGGGTGPSVEEAAAAAHRENLTVVYVAWVANADSDNILGAWWGTPTSLEDDGTMNWDPEPIDLTIAADESVATRGLHVAGSPAAGAGFTQGELPPLVVTARSSTVEAPTAEIEKSDEEAHDSDG